MVKTKPQSVAPSMPSFVATLLKAAHSCGVTSPFAVSVGCDTHFVVVKEKGRFFALPAATADEASALLELADMDTETA